MKRGSKMKTNVCKLTNDKSTLDSILAEAEKSAEYNKLSSKQALQLRLLAEEMVGMLPELLEIGDGEFWIENKNSEYELHAAIKTKRMSFDKKEEIMSMSKSGVNAASKGIINKIKIVVESMADGYVEASRMSNEAGYQIYDMGAIDGGMYSDMWSNAWSLKSYRSLAKKQDDNDAWDELEKSVIANIADDVIVGYVGRKVDIIIKKELK